MSPESSNPFAHGLPPDDEMLLAYFEGKLAPEEANQVERWLATDTPEGEALEGLEMLPAEEVRVLQNRINQQVAASAARRTRKDRRPAPMQQRWIVLAVLIILALALLASAWLAFFRQPG